LWEFTRNRLQEQLADEIGMKQPILRALWCESLSFKYVEIETCRGCESAARPRREKQRPCMHCLGQVVEALRTDVVEQRCAFLAPWLLNDAAVSVEQARPWWSRHVTS
jgi:hypothetical protein